MATLLMGELAQPGRSKTVFSQREVRDDLHNFCSRNNSEMRAPTPVSLLRRSSRIAANRGVFARAAGRRQRSKARRASLGLRALIQPGRQPGPHSISRSSPLWLPYPEATTQDRPYRGQYHLGQQAQSESVLAMSRPLCQTSKAHEVVEADMSDCRSHPVNQEGEFSSSATAQEKPG